jgi:tetratricopeptide (TPR) repeat protein
MTNLETVKPLVHFFATALQKDLNRVKDLEKLQLNHSGEARGLLQALIKEVKNYHPASLKSPKDIELLWFEYEASGNKEIIERLIKVVGATIPSEANTLQVAVIQSLIENAPYHFEVYKMLRKRPEFSIGEIVSIIHHSAFGPADEHLARGLNLYYERKYNEAMQEFNKSLSYVPDYCPTYMNIANIYDEQKNFWEAIRVGKRAVSIEPENTGALSNLAFYYQRLNEQDEAIKWYQKCLEYDPKKIDCHYGLGLAYKSKRNYDKTAIHFKKYLEYAPNGKQAPYVKQHLASIGQTVEEDPGDVAVMLQNKRYDVLEKHLLSLLRGKNRDKEGAAELFLAYEKLCNVQEPERSYVTKIAQFKSWLNQYNSSHFANACLGIVYIDYAWDARGGGAGNTITQEGGRLFEERLLTAKDYLEKAYSLDQSDPHVPASLITVAVGLGLERVEMEKQFKRAILADPTDNEAYFAKLMYLMPKWYGSREEMFSFAREAVRKAPANSMIPMVLLGAHLEVYRRSGENASYFRNPNVWKELKQVFQTASKSFPESKTTNNWFARTAYLAGDYEVARNELKKIEYDWENWQKRIWGDKTIFEEVKRELSVK